MAQTPAASEALDQLAKKSHVFPPPKNFSAAARIKSMAAYEKMYKESIKNPEKFWSKVASELHWFKPWKKVSQ